MGAIELFTTVVGLSLPEAAVRFASAEVPVFPCVPGGKRPLVEHGFRDASTDVAQVAGWWQRWTGANIGVPTGHASGVEVVDIDQKAAGSGFAAFDHARRVGLVRGWLALIRTPSGGMHAYFPADRSWEQPSWQAARAHVDFRGAGGYVLVPPSVVELPDARRGRYELIGRARHRATVIDAAALRGLLDPGRAPALRRTGVARAEEPARLARWVAALREGERNRGLFWAACRLAEGGMTPSATLDTLGPAAEHAGLPPREVLTTIRSAYRATAATLARPTAGGPGHDETPDRATPINWHVLS